MVDKDKAKTLFEEAQKISWSTKHPAIPYRAIELAEVALDEDPDYIEAAELLANDLRRANNYEKSIQIYKYALNKAKEKEPDNYKQLRNILRDLGRVLVLDEKYEEATGFLENSLEIELTSAQEYLAEAYLKLDRFKDILNLYSHVEQMSEKGRMVDEPAWYLGMAYKSLGNSKKAKEIFEAGLRFNPGNEAIKSELKSISGGCFIATAAFGSELASEVKYLKKFRDDILLKYQPGIYFVEYYYHISPKIAAMMNKIEWLKIIIRNILLRPFVFILRMLFSLEGK